MFNLICNNLLLQDRLYPDKNQLLEVQWKALSILKKVLISSRNLLEMTQELLIKNCIKKIIAKILKGPVAHKDKRNVKKREKLNK